MSVLNINTDNNQFELLKTIESNGDWTAILSTQNTFIDKNIAVKITTPLGTLGTGTATADVEVSNAKGSNNNSTNIHAALSDTTDTEPTTGYYIALNASGSGTAVVSKAGWLPTNTTATGASVSNVPKYITINPAIGTVAKVGGSITPSADLSSSATATLSETNTSGISITATGNGSVSNLDIVANITTAGYAPQGNNFATASNLSIAAASTAATATKYLTAVTVNSGKNFSVTTSGTTTITSGSNSAGTIKINAYPSSGTTRDAEQTIVSGGKWSEKIITAANTYYYGKVKANASTITSPTWSKNDTSKVATRGNFTYTTGYIATAGSLSAATFSNTASSGKTYVDLSDALVDSGGAHVIPEVGQDGFLYIDRGYIDYVKINIGRLIPGVEGTDATTNDKILNGYTAYDKDGKLITGNIQSKTAADLTFDADTRTFKVPEGYYSSEATKTIDAGTITPNYNFPGSNDTDLDNYITTTGASSSSYDVSINKTYTNTAGYIASHTDTDSGTTYYKLVSPTFANAGGSSALIADTTNTTTIRSIYTSSSDNYISIDSSAPTLANGKVYIKISSSDQIKTTSTGRGAIKSNVTIATKGTHTSYIGINLYQGDYSVT